MNGQSPVRLVFNSLQFICNSFTPLNPTIYIRNMARKEYWEISHKTIDGIPFREVNFNIIVKIILTVPSASDKGKK